MLKLYQQRWSAISARRFWERVAAARGVDPGSIIHITIPGEAYSRAFSALPEGHDKPWCWPIYPLKCERTAEEIGYE